MQNPTSSPPAPDYEGPTSLPGTAPAATEFSKSSLSLLKGLPLHVFQYPRGLRHAPPGNRSNPLPNNSHRGGDPASQSKLKKLRPAVSLLPARGLQHPLAPQSK